MMTNDERELGPFARAWLDWSGRRLPRCQPRGATPLDNAVLLDVPERRPSAAEHDVTDGPTLELDLSWLEDE